MFQNVYYGANISFFYLHANITQKKTALEKESFLPE